MPEPASRRTLQPINRFNEIENLGHYEIIKKIGQGTFGVVQKAKHVKTGKVVALKQLINNLAKEGFPITAIREITILKKLLHPNVLLLVGMIHEETRTSNPKDVITQRGVFYMVSPYMKADLVGLLGNPATSMDVASIKCIMIQLLEGINYIHQMHFLHRDIKAANILLDPHGVLKIADFGLARVYHGKAPRKGHGPGGGLRNYTGLVVTRWYRPPELLLGERKYTTAVDMWGVGCVFAELFVKKPILVGSSDSNQAQIIFGLVGPPNKANWPDATLLPNKQDLNIGLTCTRTLEAKFTPLMGEAGTDLLSHLLTLDPKARYNALDTLDHPYFKSEPLAYTPGELPIFEECHEIDKERFKRARSEPPGTPQKFKKADIVPKPRRNGREGFSRSAMNY
ncbi:Pkinase-domain-containing protein [Metschnikowia bicuspidata]|uniref:Serine/threonine-protein kinase BUR1 n=1 Tax=Metschnikowia bicuspidata TaxID=27322 RepID=A0A4P9ZCX7_9ASCO|nr:Pkinase-domain-containing protein [Metschnikowia bicuspidata]